MTSYIYIWENYRLLELPWDSTWTWYLTFLGVDFGYYWFHRMAHGELQMMQFVNDHEVCLVRKKNLLNIHGMNKQTNKIICLVACNMLMKIYFKISAQIKCDHYK